MNTPYVKKVELVDGKLVVTNPITKENPYLNRFKNRKSRRGEDKYITFQSGLKFKAGGNNRKPNKRTGKSRFSMMFD